MSQADLLPRTPATSAWAMYRAMVGVGLLCGVLIVTVYQVTLPVIQRNKAEALQRAIFQVLPGARSNATFRALPGASFEVAPGEEAGGPRIHVGYDDEGGLVGFAVEAQGMGYQDVIGILYGYSPSDDAVIGIRVLETKETPGLGDKIEKDPAFLENFRKLDVSLTADGRIAHPIETVKHGTKEQPWQIDGITGATISSKAIGDILRESTDWWIPRLRENLDSFRKAG